MSKKQLGRSRFGDEDDDDAMAPVVPARGRSRGDQGPDTMTAATTTNTQEPPSNGAVARDEEIKAEAREAARAARHLTAAVIQGQEDLSKGQAREGRASAAAAAAAAITTVTVDADEDEKEKMWVARAEAEQAAVPGAFAIAPTPTPGSASFGATEGIDGVRHDMADDSSLSPPTEGKIEATENHALERAVPVTAELVTDARDLEAQTQDIADEV